MQVSLEDYDELKREVDNLIREQNQAEGGFKEVMKQLQAEFQISKLPEAQAEFTKTEKQEQSLKMRYIEARQVFDKKWQTVLGEGHE